MLVQCLIEKKTCQTLVTCPSSSNNFLWFLALSIVFQVMRPRMTAIRAEPTQMPMIIPILVESKQLKCQMKYNCISCYVTVAGWLNNISFTPLSFKLITIFINNNSFDRSIVFWYKCSIITSPNPVFRSIQLFEIQTQLQLISRNLQKK